MRWPWMGTADSHFESSMVERVIDRSSRFWIDLILVSLGGTMAIEHKRLGAHGVIVSNICLGTMNFGWQADETESHAIMDRALDLGINFFDTADVYGWNTQYVGRTEEIIGTWFKKNPKHRDAVVLATKVHGFSVGRDDIPEPNNDGGNLSAMKIRKNSHRSLARLQTDWIDILQMHHVDRSCPWDEIWEAFDRLQQQGKVVYVGSSNFAGWDIASACQVAMRMGKSGLTSEQSIYNLDNRMVELEVIPACRGYGMGFIPWSPLGGGMLAGALEKLDNGRRSSDDFRKRVEAKRDQLAAWEGFCRELGHPPAEVGLAWLLHNPVVTAPIVGPRTIEQLESAVRATDIDLDDAALKRLNEIFPGPGGEAPSAYAW